MADQESHSSSKTGKGDVSSKNKKIKLEKKIVDYNSSEEDVKDSKSFSFDIEQAKDFYCTLCRSQMDSSKTFDMHIHGKRHIKKVQAANLASQRRMMPVLELDPNCQQIQTNNGPQIIPTEESNEIAVAQCRFDSIRDEAIVGLDFVKELWLNDHSVEPRYRCYMCEADCQLITIGDHVTGFRHRLQYLKLKDNAKYNWFSSSYHQRSHLSEKLAKESFKLERIYGRGFIKVIVQSNSEHEKVNCDVKDMDISSNDSSTSQCIVNYVVKSEPKKKLEVVPLEVKVKNVSNSAIKLKLKMEKCDASRLTAVKSIKDLPHLSLDKSKQIELIQSFKDSYLDSFLDSTPQEELDKWIEDSFRGNFQWSAKIANQMCEMFDFNKEN